VTVPGAPAGAYAQSDRYGDGRAAER
jgi:hypothetical protein